MRLINLGQNFPFRVQTGLTYPPSPCGPLSGATDLARHTPIVAVSDQSGAELPLPCPDWPYIPSLTLWPTFRGHRPRLHTPIIAASDQSGAELPLPCPDWPYLPSLTLWPTFRGHRPRPAHTYSCCVRSIWRRTSPSVSRLALPTLARPCGPLSGATDLARHTPIIAASDQSSAELPLPCPDWPYIPSLALWPTFRGHRPRLGTSIVAVSDQSGAELPLPCPGWPYLPSLTLWPTFRGHRPRPAHTYSCCVRSIWHRTSPSVSRLALPTLPRPLAHFQGPQTSLTHTYNCCAQSI